MERSIIVVLVLLMIGFIYWAITDRSALEKKLEGLYPLEEMCFSIIHVEKASYGGYYYVVNVITFREMSVPCWDKIGDWMDIYGNSSYKPKQSTRNENTILVMHTVGFMPYVGLRLPDPNIRVVAGDVNVSIIPSVVGNN